MSTVSLNGQGEAARRIRAAREAARRLVLAVIDGIGDPGAALATCAGTDVEGYWLPPAARAVGRIGSGSIDDDAVAAAFARDPQRTAEFICLMYLFTGHQGMPREFLDFVFGTQAVRGGGSWGTPWKVGEPTRISPLARLLWVAAAEGRLGSVDTRAVRVRLLSLIDRVPVTERSDMQHALTKSLPAAQAQGEDAGRLDRRPAALIWTQWAWSVAEDDKPVDCLPTNDPAKPEGAPSRNPVDEALLWALLDHLIALPAPGERSAEVDPAPAERTDTRGAGSDSEKLTDLLIRDAVCTDFARQRFVAPLIADDLRVLVKQAEAVFRAEPRTATVKHEVVSATVTLDDPTPQIEKACERITHQSINKEPLGKHLYSVIIGVAMLTIAIVIFTINAISPHTDTSPSSSDGGSDAAGCIFMILGGLFLIAYGAFPMNSELSRRANQREAFQREARNFASKVRKTHADLVERVQQAEENAEAMDRLGEDLDVALAKIEKRGNSERHRVSPPRLSA